MIPKTPTSKKIFYQSNSLTIKAVAKSLAVLLFLLPLLFSCKRPDGDTLIEGQVVDKITGQPVPNSTLSLYRSTGSSSTLTSGFTLEKEYPTDGSGKFGFQYEGSKGESYYLRAWDNQGAETIWDDMVPVEEGRNNKKLKVKLLAPCWVKVNIVDVPPKDSLSYLIVSGFTLDNGLQSMEFYNLNYSTTFVGRGALNNPDPRLRWRAINNQGITTTHLVPWTPIARDTAEFTITY
jgi:hypothetical protein